MSRKLRNRRRMQWERYNARLIKLGGHAYLASPGSLREHNRQAMRHNRKNWRHEVMAGEG